MISSKFNIPVNTAGSTECSWINREKVEVASYLQSIIQTRPSLTTQHKNKKQTGEEVAVRTTAEAAPIEEL